MQAIKAIAIVGDPCKSSRIEFLLGCARKSLCGFTGKGFPSVHGTANDEQAHIALIVFAAFHCHEVGQLIQPNALFTILIFGIRMITAHITKREQPRSSGEKRLRKSSKLNIVKPCFLF